MKRKILIITNPGVVGDQYYCEGVYKDRDNYKSFFKSAYGGFFSDSEIKVMDKPSKWLVDFELDMLQKNDIEFSIIIFCGHGYYSTTRESNILCLNDKEETINSLDLRKNYNKRIIIEDNCREKVKEPLLESLQKAFSATQIFDSGGKFPNPVECKRYYNEWIQNCSKQLICAMSCNIDETAGDSSSRGGYYTSSLLKSATDSAKDITKKIDLTKKYKILSFPECHNKAIPLVIALSGGQQNPQIDKPRIPVGEPYLPFVIIA